jgi:hypothetical protein
MSTAKNYTVKELRNRLRRSNVAPAGIDKMRKQNLINALTRTGKLIIKPSHPLNSKTVPELRKMAANKGHVGISKFVKANLIALLNKGIRPPTQPKKTPQAKKKRSPKKPALFTMPVTYINSPGLSKLTVPALRAKAAQVGLAGRSTMKKQQLVNRLTRGAVSPASSISSVRSLPRMLSPLGILRKSGRGKTKKVKFGRIATRLGFGVPKSPINNLNMNVNKPTKKYAAKIASMNNRPKPVSRYQQILSSIKTKP